ncbi:MAG: holo-ACP synthase [Actinomycetota bacterium]
MTVGIDITSIPRFRDVMARYPAAEQRFFTDAERLHCRSHPDPVIHFAGTFAAKEAVVKALGLGPVRAWARRIEITRDDTGAPGARILGRDFEHAITLSISHDGDAAVAVAIRTPALGGGVGTTRTASFVRNKRAALSGSSASPKGAGVGTNHDLRRFLGPHKPPGDPSNAPGLTALSDCTRGSDFP